MSMCIDIVMPAFAAKTPTTKTEVPKEVLAKQIENCLVEIRTLSKTNLTTVQKQELRKEMKSLRREARRNGISYLWVQL
ncbi:MAG TPA: hypothetical protein VMU83_11360 [Hanamia sp.]|nr:hypothetical protein [Hanamia sp.]